MAKMLKGILGGLSGKIGNVVGGRWKETDYLRIKVTPANPKTAAQLVQRNRMSLAVSYAQGILGAILNTYMDPFLKKFSAYNDFISKNIAKFGPPVSPAALELVHGKLLDTWPLTAVYDTATGVINYTYSSGVQANQTADDPCILVAYDEISKTFYFDIEQQTRDGGGGLLTIASGLTAADVSVYLFFAQYVEDTLFIVSDSRFMECTAA